MSPVPPPPDGFRALETEGARAWVRPEARSWAAGAIEEEGSLHRAAARDPRSRRIDGRGPVYVVPAAPDEVEAALGRPGGGWVVRRYRRGGLAARLLGERYLRWGTPRPFRETRASVAARARRLPTPRVVAAAVYPKGFFYRGDLVTIEIPDAVELADVLFDPERRGVAGAVDRKEALAAAGVLIRRAARAGVYHPDLNARNILLQWSGGAPDAWLVDLDRCRVGEGSAPEAARPMHARLIRSIRKLEKKRDLQVPEGELRVLARAVRG